MIIPTAQPFLLPGQPDQPACLLIHGFTSAPKEMRWMGEYLNQQGFTCLGVRLAGHATRPEDMIRSRYTDWIASVEDGYNLLRGLSDNIFLVGLSMGGVLSLLMSTRLEVQGVVAMSTLNQLPVDYPAWAMKLLSKVMPYNAKSDEDSGSGWFDQDAYAGHVSYPKNPVRSAAELKALLNELNTTLPKVSVPVLLIHSKDDAYVSPENMPRIYARLGTQDKEMLWVTGSGHVVTRDAAREQVFAAASAFIRRIQNGTRIAKHADVSRAEI